MKNGSNLFWVLFSVVCFIFCFVMLVLSTEIKYYILYGTLSILHYILFIFFSLGDMFKIINRHISRLMDDDV